MPKSKRSRKVSPKIIDKIALSRMVAAILEERDLNQTEAAEVMDDAPSQVSLVVNGRVNGFSPERLLRMLTRLGRDVEIRVTKSRTGRGRVRIVGR